MTRGLGLKGGFARNGREGEDAPKGNVLALAADTLAVGAGICLFAEKLKERWQQLPAGPSAADMRARYRLHFAAV